MLGEARFVAPKVLKAGDDEIGAERFVLATGSRPRIPRIGGLGGGPFVTSDTVMQLDRRPESMIVLGGGDIAAGMSHIFGSPGSRVTIVAPPRDPPSRPAAHIRPRFHA